MTAASRRRLLYFAIFAIAAHQLLSWGDLSAAQDARLADGPDWRRTESNYFNIYYRQDADLKYIARRISKAPAYGYYGLSGEGTTVEQRIAYRLDGLFSRVEDVLDMHPKMPKLDIKIFKGHEDLNAEYFKIFRKEADFKAFYINKYNTIYTSEAEISNSVLAHEMGHAVIDNYFGAIPPEKIGEVLASYVDMHLEE